MKAKRNTSYLLHLHKNNNNNNGNDDNKKYCSEVSETVNKVLHYWTV